MTTSPSSPVSELIGPYVDARIAKGKFTGDTPKHARDMLGRFARWSGDPPIGEVTEQMLDAFLMRRPCAANTMATELNHLRGFTLWCWRMRIIDDDPCARLEGPRTRRGEVRSLDVGETVELLEHTGGRALLVAVLAVQCGLRRKEVCEALVGDIDELRRRIHVRGKGYAGERSREVPIPEEAWDVVREHLGRAPDAPLVLGRDGVRPMHKGSVSRIITRALREAELAGPGRSLHALRHTFASHLLDRGVPKRTVQHLMGHQREQTTDGYDRAEPEGVVVAIEGRRYRDGGAA
jgi:integrase